jgi:hypothetical protein
LYRAGRYPEAAKKLTEWLKAGRAVQADFEGSPVEWLFLAMTHHRLKDPIEARRWLGRAAAWLDNEPAARALPWPTEVTLGLVRREAEALLKTQE